MSALCLCLSPSTLPFCGSGGNGSPVELESLRHRFLIPNGPERGLRMTSGVRRYLDGARSQGKLLNIPRGEFQ